MLENTLSLGRNAAVRKLVEIREIRVKMQLRDCLETSALNEDKIEKCFLSTRLRVN